MVFTQRRGSSFHFWMPLWTFAAAFVRVFNFRAQDRSSTKSVELNRQSFRNEIGGDRVSIVFSYIYYYLSVVCQVATILLRRESRQVQSELLSSVKRVVFSWTIWTIRSRPVSELLTKRLASLARKSLHVHAQRSIERLDRHCRRIALFTNAPPIFLAFSLKKKKIISLVISPADFDWQKLIKIVTSILVA